MNPGSPDQIRYISTKKAAQIADCTIHHISRLCREGDVRGYKEGNNWRIDETSLQEYLERVTPNKEDVTEISAQEDDRVSDPEEDVIRNSEIYPPIVRNIPKPDQTADASLLTQTMTRVLIASLLVFIIGTMLPAAPMALREVRGALISAGASLETLTDPARWEEKSLKEFLGASGNASSSFLEGIARTTYRSITNTPTFISGIFGNRENTASPQVDKNSEKTSFEKNDISDPDPVNISGVEVVGSERIIERIYETRTVVASDALTRTEFERQLNVRIQNVAEELRREDARLSGLISTIDEGVAHVTYVTDRQDENAREDIHSSISESVTTKTLTASEGLTVNSGGASITGTLTVDGVTVSGGGSINVGDKVISEGEIGVGTTTPGAKLAVQGTITSQKALLLYGVENQTADLLSFYDDPTSNTNLLTFTATGNLGLGTTSPYAKLSVVGETVASHFTATSTTEDTNLHDTLYVDSSTGRVGVGTTGPLSKLHVTTSTTDPLTLGGITDDTEKGAYIISTQYDSGTETEGWLTFAGFSDSDENRVMYGGGGSAFNAATSLHFYTAANVTTREGTEQMIIDSNGHVGIGTTSPDAKLSVTNTGSTPSFVVEDSTSPDSTPFIIDADGDVGIGTGSPDYALHVVKDDSGNGLIRLQNSSVLGYSSFDFNNSVGSGAGGVGYGNESVGITNFQDRIYLYSSAKDIVFSRNVGTDLDLVIEGSTGNVGIGTTSPDYPLDVNGDFRVGEAGSTNALFVDATNGEVGIGTGSPDRALDVSGTARFYNGALDSFRIGYTGSDLEVFTAMKSSKSAGIYLPNTYDTTWKNLIIQAHSGGSQSGALTEWQDASGNVLVSIEADGDVGIGTSTPNAPLDIDGQNSTDGDSLVISGNLDLGGFDLTEFADQRGALKAKLSDGNGVHKGYIKFATPNGAGAGIVFHDTTDTNTSWIQHNNSGNYLELNADSGVGDVYIDAAGVGLGIADPDTRLHVQGTDGTPGIVTFSNDSDGVKTQIRGDQANNFGGFYWGTSGSSGFSFDYDGNPRIGNAGGNSTWMTILTSSGNVGIGTGSPDKLLQLSSSDPILSFEETDTSTDNKIWDIRPVLGQLTFRAINDAYSVGGTWLQVDRTSTTIDTVVFPNGNIGIGTTSPWGKLSVTNTGSTPSFVVEDSTSPDSTPFIIDADGDVGIGTASPGNPLHIRRTSGSPNIKIEATASGQTAQINLENSHASDLSHWALISNTPLGGYFSIRDVTNSAYRLAIDTDGNVGIGTTSPWGKSSVTNTGTGPSFVVEDSSSPDSSPFIINADGTVGVGTADLESIWSTRKTIQFPNSMIAYTVSGTDDLQLWSNLYQDSSTADFFYKETGAATQVSLTQGTFEIAVYTSGTADTSANINRTVAMRINDTGLVGIGTTSPDYPLDVNGDFRVGEAGSTNALFVDATNGEVGIGTAAPAFKLDVTGTANISSTLAVGSTLNGAAGIRAGTNDISLETAEDKIKMISGTTIAWSSHATNIFAGTDDTSLSRLSAGVLGVGTGSQGETDGTLIAGNVGIGTDNPDSLLHIEDTTTPLLTISPGADTTADPTLYLADTGATNGFNLWYDNESGSTYFDNKWDNDAGSMYFRTKVDGTAINAFTILGTGETGIGTSTPGKLVDIFGSDSSYGMLRVNNKAASAGEATIGFFETNARDQNDAWVIGVGGWSNTNDFVIGNENNGAGGDARILIEKGGNTGIATTSPLAKLDVYGDAIISGVSRYLNFNDVSGTNGYGFRDNAGVMEFKDSGGVWTSFAGLSDAELKNIEGEIDSSSALETVRKLQGVRYQWKDTQSYGSQIEIGLIAQDVQKIVPEVVRQSGDYLAIRYGQLTALNIEAIKEIDKTVETLRLGETEIEELLIGSSTDLIPAAETEGFFSRILLALGVWIEDGVTKFERLYAYEFDSEQVRVQELCVGDTCVTEDEFKAVFGGQNTQNISGGGASDTDNTEETVEENIDTATSTESVDAPDSSDETASSTDEGLDDSATSTEDTAADSSDDATQSSDDSTTDTVHEGTTETTTTENADPEATDDSGGTEAQDENMETSPTADSSDESGT